MAEVDQDVRVLERFENNDIDGNSLWMAVCVDSDEFQSVSIGISSNDEILNVEFNPESNGVSDMNMAFDFFNNYVTLLSKDELKVAWAAFEHCEPGEFWKQYG